MSFSVPIKYYNSFWLKKVTNQNKTSGGAMDSNLRYSYWPGVPWNPTGYPRWPFGNGNFSNPANHQPPENGPLAADRMWYLEESRIRGGFNNVSVDLGARAYFSNDNKLQNDRNNYLIWSGVYNSKTNFNETNVFSVAEPIERAAPPQHGSIQKLYAKDTNLIVFQENKISRALINKNTLYSGDQGAVDNSRVVGQLVAYVGDYGISKNPESFARYGFREYFTDKNKGVVLRLGRDGLTEISSYGMSDYFRDVFPLLSDWEYYYVKADDGGNAISIVVSSLEPFTVQVTGLSTYCNITPGTVFQVIDPSTGLLVTPIDKNNGKEVIITDIDNNGYLSFNTSAQSLFPAASLSWVTMYAQNWSKSRLVGGWDIHTKNYTLSVQKKSPYLIKGDANSPSSPIPYTTRLRDGGNFDTLNFDESVLGWVSFYTYPPMWMDSLRNKYLSLYTGENKSILWKHYDDVTVNSRGLFYGDRENSFITFVLNNMPYLSKNFQTISYEGSSGWKVDSFVSDFEGENTLNAGTTWNEYQDSTTGTPPGSAIASYLEGKYEFLNPANSGLNAVNPPFEYAGFARKENRYVAKLLNTSTPRPGEIYFDDPLNPGTFINPTSGIKGFFATVKMSTDNTTNLGGMKELFSVASKYVESAR
tara:strand:- start:542 stop:2476 length:1935 start_codon:yes stop_codon:yes gene_type:complete